MRRTLAVGSSFVVLAVVLASSSSACSSHEHEDEDEASTGSSAQALESGAPSREIVATADTTLSEPAPWRNAGAVPTLHVDGARNWVLVRFDTSAINGLMAGPVALKLNIATLSGWGSDGRQLSVHRLTQSWAEPNATWACSLDSAPLNTSVDCNGKNAWTMAPPVANQKRPWVPGPTAQATIADGESGVVTFDVSSDLALFRAGTPNYGFLVKKTDESAFGVVDFASR